MALLCTLLAYSQLLQRAYFDSVMDDLGLTHIVRSKTETATKRIKSSLEALSASPFNPYCLKGKDMVHSDFLSGIEIKADHITSYSSHSPSTPSCQIDTTPLLMMQLRPIE